MKSMQKHYKKTRVLPTPVMRDPFIGFFYINKNGRVITKRSNGRWQEYRKETSRS